MSAPTSASDTAPLLRSRSAIVFYLRQGFRATGEVHEGELVLKLDLPNQAGGLILVSSGRSRSGAGGRGTDTCRGCRSRPAPGTGPRPPRE
jgi:hypothetical protein